MGMLKEFRDFAIKGNVVDMAVGIVIGAAFTKIVDALVKEVLTPPLGVITGGLDFSGWTIPLYGKATIGIGAFINAVISFVIVAFALFVIIKQINRLKRESPPADPTTRVCEFCQSTIAIKATRCPHCTSQLG